MFGIGMMFPNATGALGAGTGSGDSIAKSGSFSIGITKLAEELSFSPGANDCKWKA